jgi:hypothetical protein
MPPQQHDRLPFAGLEPRVDPLSLCRHLIQKLLIPGNVRSAGRADLHKRESPLISGIHFDEPLDPAKSFQNTLCVIHAVDTHAQERSLNA